MLLRKIEQEKVFMNTIIRITLFSDKPTIYTQQKIQDAFGCFDQVVKKYTRFSPKSELSVLNNSGGKPMKVSAELFMLIEYMLKLANQSNGSYDPTIIDLLETYGYDQKSNFESLDDPNLFDKIQKLIKIRPHFSSVKLDKDNLTIELAKRQRLDLGSVGKGYAIDLAYDLLEEFPSFMINAGGDIRTKGPKPDGGVWEIGLQRTQPPNKRVIGEELIGKIQITKGSLCGSGGWARKVKFFHHLLNPKTGMPINSISQTFTYAKTAMEADAWATILFTLGIKGLKLLEEQSISGLVVGNDGSISYTGDIFSKV
jgi:thiamine biosynthesis lipoprotein